MAKQKKGGVFEKWIDDMGVDTIAKRLKVHRATVILWRRGYGNPRVDAMRVIKRWTKGSISYEHMIDRQVCTSNL